MTTQEVTHRLKEDFEFKVRDQEPGILSLPTYVITEILDYVSISDVLQFRATNKKASQFVEDYGSRIKKRLPKTTKVFKNEAQFLQMWKTVYFAPYQKFSFSFQIRYGVIKETMERFLMKCGNEITLIQLKELHIYMDEDEMNFFKQIPNLIHLSVGEVKLWRNGYSILYTTDTMTRSVNEPSSTLSQLNVVSSLPDSLKSIQTFKFDATLDPFLIHLLLSHCTNISTLYYGTVTQPLNATAEEVKATQSKFFWNILKYFKEQSLQIKSSNECHLLFAPNSINQVDPRLVDEFCDLLSQKKLSLSGISAEFLSLTITRPNHKVLLNSIWILNVMTPFLTTQELQSLYFVNFKITADNVNILNGPITDVPNRNWPRLRVLKFTVDVPQIKIRQNSRNERNVIAFLKFLFCRRRINLQYLILNTGNLKSTEFILPRTLSFSLPNLKSVVLDIPSYSGENVCQLFLELGEKTRVKCLDLTIRCQLDDAHFIGDDEDNPNFLKMKELRHCGIKVILTPSQIRCFSDQHWERKRSFIADVLPQSSLTCLILESRRHQIFTITFATVSGILNGNLSKTLQYLSWSDSQPIRTRSQECWDAWKRLNSKVGINKNRNVSNVQEKCPKCRFM